MKIIHKSIVAITVLLFASCNKNDETTMQTNSGKTNSKSETARESSIFPAIYSMHIENGLQNSCEDNILVFDSWETYKSTIDNLDDMIEDEANAFDTTVPVGATDDEYDLLAETAGFDEDNPLLRFEEDMNFCSLRQMLLIQEDEWLAQQGDGDWDTNSDPDNHFIDDDTERALLNEGVEVIIGSKKQGLVIYKFTADEGYIAIYNMDVVDLQQINSRTIPRNNSNVVVVAPPKPVVDANCKTEITDTKYIPSEGNRIKIKSKVINTSSWSHKKIFSSTKGYIKKRGKWKLRRTLITAGITDISGYNDGLVYNQCTTEFKAFKVKEARRKKVKVKIKGDYFQNPTYNSLKIGIHDDKLYSYHKQGVININDDFYDMPNSI
jgi:hypothetical protein